MKVPDTEGTIQALPWTHTHTHTHVTAIPSPRHTHVPTPMTVPHMLRSIPSKIKCA